MSNCWWIKFFYLLLLFSFYHFFPLYASPTVAETNTILAPHGFDEEKKKSVFISTKHIIPTPSGKLSLTSWNYFFLKQVLMRKKTRRPSYATAHTRVLILTPVFIFIQKSGRPCPADASHKVTRNKVTVWFGRINKRYYNASGSWCNWYLKYYKWRAV